MLEREVERDIATHAVAEDHRLPQRQTIQQLTHIPGKVLHAKWPASLCRLSMPLKVELVDAEVRSERVSKRIKL